MTTFYNIEECCNYFKRLDIEQLKSEYKQSNTKPDKEIDDNLYYAKVEYSISTYSGRRKYIETYAIIHRCWAHINDDYKKEIIKKKIDGKHFWIKEKYQSRPEEMPEDVADAILERINLVS